MKTVFTSVLGLLLTVCLTLYGTFSMAAISGGAVFSMEICADGVAKTVLFDADGNPVEPAASCPECLTCCQATGVVFPANYSANPSLVTAELRLKHLSAQTLRPNILHIFPAPRGPPAAQVSKMIKSEPILADQIGLGQITCSDGLLLLRDAFA